MTKDVSTDDAMLNSIASQIEALEPTEQAETEGEEEETSLNNAFEATDSPEKDEAETNEKQSSSRIITKLSEEKKKLAESLMVLAQESTTAREQVNQMIMEDPGMDHYMKTKFGEKYDSLKTGDFTEKPADLDLDAIRSEERVKAKAEALKEAFVEKQTQAINDFAELKAFTAEEADAFKEHVEFLQSKYEFEEALNLAGQIVAPTKMKTSNNSAVVRGANDKPIVATVDPDVNKHAQRTNRTPEQVVQSLKEVEANLGKDGVLRLSDR